MKTKAISKNSKGIKKDTCGSSTASSVQNAKSKKGTKKVDKNKIVKTVCVWTNQKDYFQMDRCYDNW